MVTVIHMPVEEEKNPLYWEGVRDTFRLVLEFLDWKEQNPESPSTLEKYLKAAQKQVATKTSPTLVDILGVPFKKS